MISRVISCTIQRDKVDDFRNAINYDYLPRIQAQPGFLENVESCDPETGKYLCLTLWNSEADVKRYDEGLFSEIAARIGPMIAGAPEVFTLPTENASAHNLYARHTPAMA